MKYIKIARSNFFKNVTIYTLLSVKKKYFVVKYLHNPTTVDRVYKGSSINFYFLILFKFITQYNTN